METRSIPVFRTALGGIALTLRRLRPIIRIVWLPLLLSAGISVLPLMILPNRSLSGLTNREIASLFDLYDGASILADVLSLGLMVMAVAGVYRFHLKGQEPGLPFLFRWGRDEWRLIGVLLIQVVVYIGTFLGFLIIAAFLTTALVVIGSFFGAPVSWSDVSLTLSGGGGASGPFLLWVRLLSFVGLASVLWIYARLVLMAPVAIAERSLDIRRTFRISSGQTLRILLILTLSALLVQAPLLLTAAALDIWLLQGMTGDYLFDVILAPSDGHLASLSNGDVSRLMAGGAIFNLVAEIWQIFFVAVYTLIYRNRLSET